MRVKQIRVLGFCGPGVLRFSSGEVFASAVSMRSHTSKSDLCKGMFAGALAGIVASFAMTRFHVALSGDGVVGAEEPQSNKPVDGNDDAAMKAADLVAQATTGEALTREEKTEVGGPLAHYAFGAFAGALYGAVREVAPNSQIARGGLFGFALWLSADQVMLPMIGLSPWPLKAYPASTNAQHLVSHLVYGWTADETYQSLRQAL